MKDLLQDKHPMYMEDFLRVYGHRLKDNVRALYVVEPNLEKRQILKFGIAGMQSGNAYHRLNEYRILYGEHDPANRCKGVIIHYCGITKYNRLVEIINTQVYRVEKTLKEIYKTQKEEGRGVERISGISSKDLVKQIRIIVKHTKDTETNNPQNTRNTTQVYRNDRGAFVGDIRRSARLQNK